METSSECSDNSLLYLNNLQRLVAEENSLLAVDEESEREVDELIGNPPVADAQIGFGVSSAKKAESFAKNRMVVSDASQDVLSMVELTTTEEVIKIIREEKPNASSNINLKFDVGIEVFPQYALEYLKHKYNII